MTLGSRSSPASAIAGSPGSSCCRPKISTDTKNSVGMIAASRFSRKSSTGAPASAHLQVLQPDDAVGNGAKPGELVGVGPQPVAVGDIDDGPVLRDLRGDLLEDLAALGGVGGRGRPFFVVGGFPPALFPKGEGGR